MTIWKDISPHIHKIVSCVLTIPFVELCPNRHRPAPQSSVHTLQHIFKHARAGGYPLSAIYHSPNKLYKKDAVKEDTAALLH